MAHSYEDFVRDVNKRRNLFTSSANSSNSKSTNDAGFDQFKSDVEKRRFETDFGNWVQRRNNYLTGDDNKIGTRASLEDEENRLKNLYQLNFDKWGYGDDTSITDEFAKFDSYIAAERYNYFADSMRNYVEKANTFSKTAQERFSGPSLKDATRLYKQTEQPSKASKVFMPEAEFYVTESGEVANRQNEHKAKEIEKTIAGVPNTYVAPYRSGSDASDYLTEAQGERDDLNASRQRLKEIYSKYAEEWKKMGLTDEAIKNIEGILSDDNATNFENIVKAAQTDKDYWGKFASEEDYKDRMYQLNRYKKYSNKADFEENSREFTQDELDELFNSEYVPEANPDEVYVSDVSGKVSILYGTDNGAHSWDANQLLSFLQDPKRIAALEFFTAQSTGEKGYKDYSEDLLEVFGSEKAFEDYIKTHAENPLFYINEQESRVARYIFRTEDEESMKDYIDGIYPELGMRLQGKTYTDAKLTAEEFGGWGVAANTVKQLSHHLVSGGALVEDVIAGISDNEINPYSSMHMHGIKSNALIGASSDYIKENAKTEFGGKVGSFLYEGGASVLNFVFDAAVGYALGTGLTGNAGSVATAGTRLAGGAFAKEATQKVAQNITLTIMSSSAASDAVMNAKLQGLEDWQAISLGAVAFGAEYLAENISWNALFKGDSSNVISYILKNARDEGLEEVFSQSINDLAEFVIRGGENRYTDLYNELLKENSRAEANKKVWLTVLDDYLQAGAGGALSGLAMSGGMVGGSYVGSSIKDHIEMRNAQYDGDAKTLMKLVEVGLQSGDSKFGKQAQKISTLHGEEMQKLVDGGMASDEAFQTAAKKVSVYDAKKLGSLYAKEVIKSETKKASAETVSGSSAVGVELSENTPSVKSAIDADIQKVTAEKASLSDITKAAITEKNPNGIAVTLKDNSTVAVVGVAEGKGGNTVYLTSDDKKISPREMSFDGSYANNVLEFSSDQEYSAETSGALLQASDAYVSQLGGSPSSRTLTSNFDMLYSAAFENGTTITEAAEDMKLVQAIHAIGVKAANIAMDEGLRQRQMLEGSNSQTKIKTATRSAAVEIKSDVEVQVSEGVKKVLEKMSSIGNMKIVVENFSEGDKSKGYYSNGEIHLNAKKLSGEYMTVVAIHEAGHHVRANNKAGYDVLKKYVRRYLELEGENVHTLLKEIKENREAQGENLTPEEIMEELVANTISSIASNEKAMQAFLKMDAKERVTLRRVLQNIAERVKSIASKLTGAEGRMLLKDSDNLLTLAKEMNKALKDAGENVGIQKNTARGGVKKYSSGISMSDIQVLRSIGRKSVNDFTGKDIEIAQEWAEKFYKEIGIKSPFFRAWFGDWRAYDITKISVVKNKSATRAPHKNIDTGWDINVSARVYRETNAHASKKSQAARVYLDYLDEIIKNAVLLDTIVISPEKSENSLFMHSLYAVADIGNGPELLKLYVEEMNNPNSTETSKRAYMLQNIEKQQLHVTGSHTSASPIITTAVVKTISDLHSIVKMYDTKFIPKPVNPIFLNDDGIPIVYYHGTNAEFTEFDRTKSTKIHLNVLGEGNYFTSKASAAERYGQNVIDAYLKADNPYIKKEGYVLVADQINEEFGVNIRSKDVQDFLKQKGFDGVVVLGDDGKVVMANIFDSERIKSPSKNIGTFNLDKKDYRYSYGDESVDFWGVLDPMDEADAETSELLRGYMETAGEILSKTRGVELKEGEVRRIANSILRKYTGHYSTEHAQRIELILDVAQKNPVYPIEDIVGEVAAVVKDAFSTSVFIQDIHAEERAEVFEAMRGFGKTYLTRDQLETLESSGLSLNWFKQRMAGKITVVKSSPQNEVNMSSFEVVYRDLANQYPEWFRSDVDSSEMPEELLRSLDKLKPHVLTSENFFEQGDDETSIKIASELLSGVIDAKYRVSKKADIKELREKLKKYKENWVLNQTKTAHIKNVEKYASSFLKWIDKPSKKQSVPEMLQEPILELLNAFDFTKGKLYKGEVTAHDKGWGDKMMTVATALEDIAIKQLKSIDEGGTEWSYFDINPELVNDLKVFAEAHKGEKVYEMDGRTVAHLDGLMLKLRNTVTSANRLHANKLAQDVSELADESIREFDKKKGGRFKDTGNARTNTEKVLSVLDNELLFNTADAFTFQKMLGSAGESVMQELWDGYLKFIENVDSIKNWTEKHIDSKTVRKWRKETHTLKLSEGSTVTLTVPQMMELYALSKRKQAQGHIYGYGIVIDRNLIAEKAQKKAGKEISVDADPYTLTVLDVANIVSKLSEEQRTLADEMQKYLSEDMAALGNEVTMKRYMYRRYVTRNYWPIQVVGDMNKVSDSTLNQFSLYAVGNPGFSKQTQEGANNAIVIHDIFNSFSKHCGQMAMLNGMSIPLSDALKWYNYTEGGKSLKGSMKKALSVHSNKWFIKFLSDLNNQSRVQSSGAKIAEWFVRNSKAAAIWGNMRVVLQQFSAYTRAMNVLDVKYLYDPRNITDKHGVEEALKYCPVAKWKSYGFYTTDIGQSLENIILPDDNVLDKTKAVGFVPAGKADEATWGVLWNASKRQVLAQNKAIKKNSEEHMKLTAELLDRVVNETQVVDTPFHRAQIRRSDNFYEKIISSFMDEPIKSFNMLRNAILTKDGKKIGRAVTSYVVTSIFAAALASLVDWERQSGDDDEDDDKGILGWVDIYEPGDSIGEKYLDILVENSLENLNILKLNPYTNKAISLIGEGYNSSGLDEVGIKTLVSSFKHLLKRVKGESDRPFYADLYEGVKAISQLSGIGLHTAMRDVVGFTNMFMPDGMKITTGGYTKTALAEYAVDALLRGDKELYDELYDKLYDKCGGAGYEADVEKALYGALSKTPDARVAITAMEDGDKKLYDKTVNELLDKGFSLNVVIKGTNSLRSSYNNKVVGIYEALEKGDDKKAEEYYQSLEKIGFTREEIDDDLKAYEEGREAWKFDKISDASMIYNYSFLLTMLDSNQMKEYEEIYDYLIDHGKSDSDIKSAVTRNYKGEYFDAWLNSDSKEMRRIESKLEDTDLYEDVEKDTQEWLVSELKKMYLSTDDPKEREEVRTLLWKTGKWDSLYELDKRLEAWREADGE